MGLRPLKRYTTVVDAQKVAQHWYQQAVHDLEMARRNLTVEGYDVAAFLAHQAVEKLLKAAFALEGRPVPRTHHLDEMASQLGLPDELQDALLDLTSDYAVARYPEMLQARSPTCFTRTTSLLRK
jgi:HEPN domain-containing protein